MAQVLHPAPRIASNAGVREALSGALGGMLVDSKEEYGEIVLTVQRERIEDALRLLRDEQGYQQLMDIAGVDYPARPERFELVYMLLSLTRNHRVMVKVTTNEMHPVPTVTTLWPNAGWLEREVFDMFGVVFAGNTDLRRILTDYGFEGFPFRKDFPLTGYVEVRYSEEDQRVIYEPVQLRQDLRSFDFMSPWEGADYVLPGDEKAATPPPASAPVPTKPETGGPSPSVVPKTTDTPAETGAGPKDDADAAKPVAPSAPASESKEAHGQREPVAHEPGIPAPGAPDPTEDPPGREPREKGEASPKAAPEGS